MKIKKLFTADCFPHHMVIETVDGEYKIFFITPFRCIIEKDLQPLRHWYPIAGEAEPYMYSLYGFEKVK